MTDKVLNLFFEEKLGVLMGRTIWVDDVRSFILVSFTENFELLIFYKDKLLRWPLLLNDYQIT